MADQPVTREKLINADKDVQVIEDFIKKPKDETVTTRFGDEIMTLKGLEEEVKKSGGYFKRYTSLAVANADIANIPVNSVVKVTDAVNGGDYEKVSAEATSLTKSPYDPFEKSLKKINELSGVDANILASLQLLLQAVLVFRQDYDTDLSNILTSIQDNLNSQIGENSLIKSSVVNLLVAFQQLIDAVVMLKTSTDESITTVELTLQNNISRLLAAISSIALAISDNRDDFDAAVKIINENTANTSKLNTSIQSIVDAIITIAKQVDDITLTEADKLEALFIEQCKAAELSKLDGFDPSSSGSNTYVSSENIAIFPTPDELIRIDVQYSGVLPTAKGVTVNTENKINVSGQVLSCFGTLEVQGSSSAYYPKKNWTLAFFSDADRENPIAVKLGHMKEHEELVFKSNFVDNTHTRNIAVNRAWDQMQLARSGFPKRECDFVNMTSGNGVASMPTGATGHVDGFPAVMYINGEFYGLGCLNIGKKRGNYNLKKTNPKHIQLDPEGDVNIYALPATPFDNPTSSIVREAFDVRNPSEWTAECQGYYDRLRTFLSQTRAQMEAAGIDNYINRASMMDYIILIQVFDLYDHIHKNTLYTTWDGNVWHFLPYDVDTAMGLHTNGRYVDESNNEYHPASTLRIPSSAGDHNWGTMAKFRQIYGSALDSRYADLRHKNIISVENIVNICESLVRKFPVPLIEAENTRWNLVSGGEIWSTIQQTGSINQIHSWLSIRLPLCDTYFNFTSEA